jgi:hypothetical protein
VAVNLRIASDVIDIRRDHPRPNDQFYVDTNAWYWMTYSRASLLPSGPRPYQVNDYPNYIKKCLNVSASLISGGLSIGELASIVERAEWEIFKGAGGSTSRKEFRHNLPTERARVLDEIQGVWSQVQLMSKFTGCTVDLTHVDGSLSRMVTEMLDGYDALVVDWLLGTGCDQVITDDMDFATVPGLTIFTSNWTVINEAATQGRLIDR